MSQTEAAGVPKGVIYAGVAALVIIAAGMVAQGGVWTAGKVKQGQQVLAKEDKAISEYTAAQGSALAKSVMGALEAYSTDNSGYYPATVEELKEICLSNEDVRLTLGKSQELNIVYAKDIGLGYTAGHLSPHGTELDERLPLGTVAYAPYISEGKAKNYALYGFGMNGSKRTSVIAVVYGE